MFSGTTILDGFGHGFEWFWEAKIMDFPYFSTKNGSKKYDDLCKGRKSHFEAPEKKSTAARAKGRWPGEASGEG